MTPRQEAACKKLYNLLEQNMTKEGLSPAERRMRFRRMKWRLEDKGKQ